MSLKEMKVLVVDPHPIVREGLRQFLETQELCYVVAEADDGNSALAESEKHEHDVMLINAVLPGSDIFNTISSYKSKFSDRRVVVCHVVADLSTLQEFHKSGADGFIGQNAKSSEYNIAVRTVMEGGCFFSGNLADAVFSVSKAGQDATNAYGLTSRELEILSLLANGLCNKEIANQFDLSVRTVEAHRLNIRRKTTSNTLSELVRVARSLGIAHLGNGSAVNVPREMAAE